jgi:NADPH-dependent curcumin reductase CurA
MKGPSNYLSLLVNRASMTGMLVRDYYPRAGEARAAMAQWRKEGKLKTREHIVDGLSTFPERLLMLFTGQNQGKLELRVAED